MAFFWASPFFLPPRIGGIFIYEEDKPIRGIGTIEKRHQMGMLAFTDAYYPLQLQGRSPHSLQCFFLYYFLYRSIWIFLIFHLFSENYIGRSSGNQDCRLIVLLDQTLQLPV